MSDKFSETLKSFPLSGCLCEMETWEEEQNGKEKLEKSYPNPKIVSYIHEYVSRRERVRERILSLLDFLFPKDFQSSHGDAAK
jgi:hypothetical protein